MVLIDGGGMHNRSPRGATPHAGSGSHADIEQRVRQRLAARPDSRDEQALRHGESGMLLVAAVLMKTAPLPPQHHTPHFLPPCFRTHHTSHYLCTALHFHLHRTTSHLALLRMFFGVSRDEAKTAWTCGHLFGTFVSRVLAAGSAASKHVTLTVAGSAVSVFQSARNTCPTFPATTDSHMPPPTYLLPTPPPILHTYLCTYPCARNRRTENNANLLPAFRLTYIGVLQVTGLRGRGRLWPVRATGCAHWTLWFSPVLRTTIRINLLNYWQPQFFVAASLAQRWPLQSVLSTSFSAWRLLLPPGAQRFSAASAFLSQYLP